jgi:hypothetical protein
MPTRSTKSGPTRQERIYITEDFECRYWTMKLNVTYEELLEAVQKVGPMVADVRRYLGKDENSSPESSKR